MKQAKDRSKEEAAADALRETISMQVEEFMKPVRNMAEAVSYLEKQGAAYKFEVNFIRQQG